MSNPYGYGADMGMSGPMGGPMGGPNMSMASQMGGPMGGMGQQMMSGGQIGPQMMPANMVDPAQNNQPLSFDMNKGKPPMAMSNSGRKSHSPTLGRSRSDSLGDKNGGPMAMGGMGPSGGMDDPDLNNMMGHMNTMMQWGTMMGGAPGGPGGGSGMPAMDQMMAAAGMMGYGPMAGGGFMGGDFSMMGGMGPGPGFEGRPKEIITYKEMTLYPPPPSAPPSTTRERPPGCRTVFVGGLPENMTEDLIKEMFDDCGPICSIRMSKKKFAHIRFETEDCVDKALFYSGYRIKIENKDDNPNTGRIHVDFAQARDDLYEWECKQRALQREQRHRMRIEEERLRPPSPPPVIHFSDHEAGILHEKLKEDESFMKATAVLMTWLERGDCNRRTANSFYSMVQSVNSHVRRLMNEKQLHDDEFEMMKKQFRDRMEGIIRQFEQIDKVFISATKQKAWDHFSKAQRKNLDLWRKQCHEIRQAQESEFLQDRQEAEMDMESDSEADPGPSAAKRMKEQTDNMALWMSRQASSENDKMAVWMQQQLKQENDDLKCQLEAYKNEVDILKSEHTDSGQDKDMQIKSLKQALEGFQLQLLETKKNLKEEEDSKKQLQLTLQVAQRQVEAAQSAAKTLAAEAEGKTVADKSEAGAKPEEGKEEDLMAAAAAAAAEVSSSDTVSERQAKLVALISTFLNVHPKGASVDYIWSYLQQTGIKIRTSELEDLLEKLPTIFKQEIMGVGASIEKRWTFIGFQN